MFDIGAEELLLIVVVAILVIGPKDMPAALRAAGRWVGKLRRLSGHFRTGIDAMIREAEMEEMEKKWKAQNERIMRLHPEGPGGEMEPLQSPAQALSAPDAAGGPASGAPLGTLESPPGSSAESRIAPAHPDKSTP